METKEATKVFESNELARILFGVNNENLKVIENNPESAYAVRYRPPRTE